MRHAETNAAGSTSSASGVVSVDLLGWCSHTTAIMRPHFNGVQWHGGGVRTCSRKAVTRIGTRCYCTYHARKLQPNT